MPLPPIEPRDVRVHRGVDLRLRQWQAPGNPAFLLLLPTRDGSTAGYDAYAAALCDAGLDVAVLMDPVAPIHGVREALGALMQGLRADGDGRPWVLAGHGIGAIVACDYMATQLPQPQLVALLAPSLAAPSSRSVLQRVVPGRRIPSPSSDFEAARVRAVAMLSETPRSVYIELGWNDPLVDRAIAQKLQATRPLGDVWNFPALGHDLPNISGWQKRASQLASWVLRRGSEQWPDAFPDPDARRPDRLDRPEALARHDAFVASEGDRVLAFMGLVESLGGPPPEASAAGMRRLGAWLAGAVGPGPRDGAVPEWARDAIGPQARLSTDSMWLVDGTAALVMAGVRATHPEARWELCTDRRDSYYHMTLLQPLHLPSEVLVGNILRSLLDEGTSRDWLANLWTGTMNRLQGMQKVVEAGDGVLPLDEVAVEPYDGEPWNAQLWIPEGAETALGEKRFEALPQQIGKLPGIQQLAWEDREVMLLVLAKGTAHDAVREAVVRLLRAALNDVKPNHASDPTAAP